MEIVDQAATRPIRLNVMMQHAPENNVNGKHAAPPSQQKENDYDRLWRETAKGLRYCHKRINANTSKALENASFLYALVELLVEKGLITVEELDERKKKFAERLVQKFKESGIGLIYQDPESDKYAFEHEVHVDCENRTHVCQALCCKLPFALSQQDVDEGIVRWDFGRPYVIAHEEDGYCTHLDRETYGCTIREHRPVPCRGFDCRDNKKWHVWLDFDNMEINTELMESLAKQNGHAQPQVIDSEE